MTTTIFSVGIIKGFSNYLTILNIEFGDFDSSLLHIEYSKGIWKFQLFFYPFNKCITL